MARTLRRRMLMSPLLWIVRTRRILVLLRGVVLIVSLLTWLVLRIRVVRSRVVRLVRLPRIVLILLILLRTRRFIMALVPWFGVTIIALRLVIVFTRKRRVLLRLKWSMRKSIFSTGFRRLRTRWPWVTLMLRLRRVL